MTRDTRRRPQLDREQHPAAYALGLILGWLFVALVALVLVGMLALVGALLLLSLGWPA